VLFLLLALGHDGRAQTTSEIFWQLVELLVTVYLDCLLGCVANDVTVVAPGQMVFQFSLGPIVKGSVQVAG
jgi:hypothetical protein